MEPALLGARATSFPSTGSSGPAYASTDPAGFGATNPREFRIRSIDIDQHERQRLREEGFLLLPGPFDGAEVAEVLQRFGLLTRQYSGTIEHEVTATEGFEGRRHSKSVNAIGVHTEAPAWNPPPRYLALHCHEQARCGGGHTDLVDGRSFLRTLPASAVESMSEELVAFPAEQGETVFGRRLLESTPRGETILRFSVNLFTYGDLNAPLTSRPGRGVLPEHRRLAALAESFRKAHQIRILIPDGGLLIWENWRMMHARSAFSDLRRRLTRYWLTA